MVRTVCIFIWVSWAGLVYGQNSVSLELMEAESRMQDLFVGLYMDSLSDPEPILKEILAIMPDALALEGAMEFPWNGLDRIGVRTSDDGQIRIFTWHVTDDPDHYRYFGFMQVALKRDRIRVFPLYDNFKEQQGIYNLDQSTDNWYGKLVYSVVAKKVKRKTYYTLLGMDFHNSRTNLKTIEVLRLHRNEPQFVKGMFYNGKERVDRVVLEYSTQVAMTVRYDPGLDMIAFDHLVPLHAVYQGNFEFYGPDGSFDGLEFEEGSWLFREDIDARMEY